MLLPSDLGEGESRRHDTPDDQHVLLSLKGKTRPEAIRACKYLLNPVTVPTGKVYIQNPDQEEGKPKASPPRFLVGDGR